MRVLTGPKFPAPSDAPQSDDIGRGQMLAKEILLDAVKLETRKQMIHRLEQWMAQLHRPLM